MNKTILGIDIQVTERDDIVRAINRGSKKIGEERAEESEGKRFPLSPSQCLNSLRDMYYGLVNYYNPGTIPTDPFPPELIRTFEMGHLAEDMLTAHMEKGGIKIVKKNQRVTFGRMLGENNRDLDGEYDFLMQNKKGEIILGDSKTSKSGQFRYYVPNEKNIAQLNLYLHSEDLKKLGVKKAVLFYIDKDSLKLRTFEFEYNEELALKVLERFQKVYTMYEKGELPPREYVFGPDFMANYSSYRTYEFRDFKKPVEDRNITQVKRDESDFDSSDEKLRWMALNYDTDVIQWPCGLKQYLVLGKTKLIIKGGLTSF